MFCNFFILQIDTAECFEEIKMLLQPTIPHDTYSLRRRIGNHVREESVSKILGKISIGMCTLLLIASSSLMKISKHIFTFNENFSSDFYPSKIVVETTTEKFLINFLRFCFSKFVISSQKFL